MKRISGIVFDFGGVISAPPDGTFYTEAEKLTGWDKETILAGWRRHRTLMDADEISAVELYRRIATDLGANFSDEVYEKLKALDYDSWVIPNPETLAWAKKLKAQGYKVGILTNMPTDFVPWFQRCAGAFRALADAELISGEVHLVKPQAEIYALMAERMALPAEELLFFDDTLANVEGARACGWSAHRFTTVAEAQRAYPMLPA